MGGAEATLKSLYVFGEEAMDGKAWDSEIRKDLEEHGIRKPKTRLHSQALDRLIKYMGGGEKSKKDRYHEGHKQFYRGRMARKPMRKSPFHAYL